MSSLEDVEEYVRQSYAWSQLPASVKQALGQSKDQWELKVKQVSIKYQLPWSTSLVKDFLKDEKTYYEHIMRFVRTNLMLFPYHLIDDLVRVLKITPFKYYVSVMLDSIKAEKSYDALPNFAAADCLRLLGIGRNQYIDMMNHIRGKGWLWRQRRTTLRGQLPPKPLRPELQPWWIVKLFGSAADDPKNTPAAEQTVLSSLQIAGKDGLLAGELPYEEIHSLYVKCRVYVVVPIEDEDQIIVPPLQGFVMNRVLGDVFEKLLYKIFVSIDERTTVKQLAELLQIDVSKVKNAVSVYCRLGFALKKNAPLMGNDGQDCPPRPGSAWHQSWMAPMAKVRARSKTKIPAPAVPADAPQGGDGDQSLLVGSPNVDFESSLSRATDGPLDGSDFTGDYTIDSDTPAPSMTFTAPADAGAAKRIAFMFDSTLTAFLMMGNLSQGLKTHAVTMFEVGKLPDEQLQDFMEELEKVNKLAEGDTQRYFDHAVTLLNTLKYLRSNSAMGPGGLDMIRVESLASLDPRTRLRVLRHNYCMVVASAPLANDIKTSGTISLARHIGPPLSAVTSPWFKLFIYHIAGRGPPSMLFPKGTRLSSLPHELSGSSNVSMCPWGGESITAQTATILPLLNEQLIKGPVLVQCRVHLSDEMDIINVPFPLTKDPTGLDVRSGNGTDDEDTIFTPENMHKHPDAVTVECALALDHTAGYMSFVRNAEVLQGARQYLLTEINFGVPLFDVDLNTQILHKVDSHRLLSEENMSAHVAGSRHLCLHLLKFIADCRGEPIRWDTDLVEVPTRPIVFDGHTMRTWSSSAIGTELFNGGGERGTLSTNQAFRHR